MASTRVALEALDTLTADGTAQATFALWQVRFFPFQLSHADGRIYSRPPGHHATDSLCGGYCYLNSAAIAARHFQRSSKGDKPRVAILDIDYHHGNGTMFLLLKVGLMLTMVATGTSKIFYDDPTVLYVSLHGSPDYPCASPKASTNPQNLTRPLGRLHRVRSRTRRPESARDEHQLSSCARHERRGLSHGTREGDGRRQTLRAGPTRRFVRSASLTVLVRLRKPTTTVPQARRRHLHRRSAHQLQGDACRIPGDGQTDRASRRQDAFRYGG